LRLIWLVRDVRGFVSSFLQPEPNTHSDSIYHGWFYDTIDFWALRYEHCAGLETIDKAKLNDLTVLLSNLSAPAHQRLAAIWTVDTTLMKYYLESYVGKFFLLQ